MKVLSHQDPSRLQDRVDLNALVSVAKVGDVELAKTALSEIAKFGFSNSRIYKPS